MLSAVCCLLSAVCSRAVCRSHCCLLSRGVPLSCASLVCLSRVPLSCASLRMLVENQLSAADCIAAFRQFDRDGNGLIDAAEFSFVLSTLLGLHLTKPQMTQLWRGLDINNSGVINFAEARRIVPTNAPRTSHPHPPAHAHPHPHPHPHPSPIHLAPPSLRPQFNSTLFSDSPCSTLSSPAVQFHPLPRFRYRRPRWGPRPDRRSPLRP